MDKFIVSARKYRPQTFDTVVGQSHITTTLKNAIRNDQLAHAFLFCGPRGVGKTTCARILAKTINCEARTADTEACNTCSSCRSFNEGGSLNIHELDAASNNSVEDIRSLTEQVRFTPQAGKYKVYIIDEVHMLTTQAFNAFLKTLEEPPPYAIFILATTEKHKVLPTILSRCQIFDFKRITTSDTVEHLEHICTRENIQAEKPALHVIAQKSEGCMRDALSIMDKIISFTNGELTYKDTLEHLNILDEDYYFRFMDFMAEQDLSSALLLYNDINSKGFEGDLVLNGMAEFIRNLLVSKDKKALALLDVAENFRPRYAETAAKADPAFLISALNILNESEINYKSARNKRLHVELTLIKLTYLKQALQVSSGEGGLSKKKLIDSGGAVAFRNIPIVAYPAKKKAEAPTAATLIIEEPAKSTVKRHMDTDTLHPTTERKEEMTIPQPAANAPKAPKKERSTRIGRLDNIRSAIGKEQGAGQRSIIPLDPESLRQHWSAFTGKLIAEKNPAYKPFELARLEVLDESNFTVITNNNLEQKFIEQEKMRLSEYLQNIYSNRKLFFAVTVTENPVIDVVVENTMTKRDQFLKMAENYPLVRELKDRLNLELDY